MTGVWQLRPLGDVCEFSRGLTYAKSDEVESSSSVVLRANNVNLQTGILDLTELRYIDDRIVVPESKKVRPATLLICTASGSKSHLGKVAFVDRAYGFAFGGFMGLLEPREGLNPRFLFHLMTSPSYKDYIRALSDGVNINNLKWADLAAFPVPFPPLAEQERIVRILDEALAGIATARANTEGSTRRSNELFEAVRDASLDQPGSLLRRVGDVCTGFDYGTASKSSTQGAMPVLRMGNLQDGEIDWTNLVFTSDDDDIKRYRLDEGDVVFNRTNSAEHVGKAAIFRGEQPALFAGYLVRVKADPAVLNSWFLNYYLNGTVARSYGRSVMSRSINQANISAAKLRGYPIRVPSLAEQAEVVSKLDALRVMRGQLQESLRARLASLEAVRGALLKQAFAGEL